MIRFFQMRLVTCRHAVSAASHFARVAVAKRDSRASLPPFADCFFACNRATRIAAAKTNTMIAQHTMSAVFSADKPHVWLAPTESSITDLQYEMFDDDCWQLMTVSEAVQHELDADIDGSVHIKRHVPDEYPLAEPLAPVSVDTWDDEKPEELSSSKKPEFITHSAYARSFATMVVMQDSSSAVPSDDAEEELAEDAVDAMAVRSILRCHQELMSLYSTSTREARDHSSSIGSIGSIGSVLVPAVDRGVSQRDLAALEQSFQFIRDDDADAKEGEKDWRVRMSVRYYRQLFREYALADLSRFEEGKIGLRWRTGMEVVSGKGQFSCGNKRCDTRAGLHSYELLFAYVEHGERKRCLVKVRVCEDCAEKLFYQKLQELRKKQVKKERTKEKGSRKRKLHESESADAGKHKVKKRRRAVSCSSSSEGSNAGGREVDEGDQVSLTGGSIHKLCVKINAQQKAARSGAQVGDSSEHDVSFAELLP
ncbi:hypothetical protein BBJ28_00011487 [Nothophytophthora sp. Chile5]|nr:hypothetical protein BBJ28_00011487 [Nothophytophthora sp. Chile5]